MKTFTVAVQVIEAYTANVVAEDENEAIDTVQGMKVADVRAKGNLGEVVTDYIELEQDFGIRNEQGWLRAKTQTK